MAEVLFYHLERSGLEEALPPLLEKTLAKGWRAIVHPGSEERAAALDAHLWTYRDDSFLPHGLASAPHAEHQPVLISLERDNRNRAQAVFLVDGADWEDWTAGAAGAERVVVMFDGRDTQAVAAARQQWTKAKAAGFTATYWQQTASGGWEKRA